jgi:hypothetical protein
MSVPYTYSVADTALGPFPHRLMILVGAVKHNILS